MNTLFSINHETDQKSMNDLIHNALCMYVVLYVYAKSV